MGGGGQRSVLRVTEPKKRMHATLGRVARLKSTIINLSLCLSFISKKKAELTPNIKSTGPKKDFC